jgi:Uma2 family endonuclease
MVTAQQLAGLMPDTRELLSDEPQMESTQHYQQLALLVSHLEWHWREQTDFFIGANLTVYYTLEQLRTRKFLGPDFFLVRGVDSRPRTSWAVWNEDGRYPDLIIELLSDSTAEVDRTEKRRLYQNVFHTHEYFWFSPITGEFVGFRLTSRWYEAIPLDERGLRWSEELGLYLGVVDQQLRYFAEDGTLVLGPEETALREQHRAELAESQVKQTEAQLDQEHQRAERLAQWLRDLGVDLDG